MPDIPEPDPIGDSFTGVIVQVGSSHLLSTSPLLDYEVLESGNFVVRYGVRYLGKPHQSVVPGIIALDYGDFLTGEAGWDFLLNKSSPYPRSEVVGYRNDGAEEMIPIKLLDLVQPIEVLVYEDAVSIRPLASVKALIVDDATHLAERLLEYLPYYETIIDWLKEQDLE